MKKQTIKAKKTKIRYEKKNKILQMIRNLQ